MSAPRKRGEGAKRAKSGSARSTDGKGKGTATKHEHSAGGVVVRDADGERRFLLIRDSYGHWGFPKGHVERGERADTAALREVMEETGLNSVSTVESIATIEWFFRFRGTLIHKRCEFFLMRTTSEVTTPQRSEGITACRWTTLDEAQQLIAYANARDVLRQAEDLLARRDVDALPSPT